MEKSLIEMTNEEFERWLEEYEQEEKQYKEWLNTFTVGKLIERFSNGVDNICDTCKHS